jgi:molybdopterin-binding protein
MKISARNALKGKVVKLTKGAVNTMVVIEIAKGIQITSIVTNDAAKDLKLAKGKPAYAVIKASSVMIGVDE